MTDLEGDTPLDEEEEDDDDPKGIEEMDADQLLPGGRRPRLSRAFTSQQLIEIENAFKMFDADGNGSIDRREMKVAMKALGMSTKADDIARIMDEVDVDGSGTIDKDEFIEIVRPVLGGRDPHSEVRKCFEYFDVNESGVITAADLVTVMEELGEDVTSQEVEAMMEVADRDGDGAVSMTEFVRLAARLNLAPPYDPQEAAERDAIRERARDAAAASEKMAEAL
jgi:Ca2+-binding EF-hand superfamily protein